MKLAAQIKFWLGRKSVRIALVLGAIALLALAFHGGNDDSAAPLEAKLPVVTLITPTKYAGEQALSVIGTVRPFTEAKVTAERAGRVVSVPVTLGQSVAAGTVLATLENASERAAVLQAEGVYEAAVAAAAQSDVSVDQAQNTYNKAKTGALLSVQSSFNQVESSLITTIDFYYNQPSSPATQLKIWDLTYKRQLELDRVAIGKLLPIWKAQNDALTTESDLESALTTSRANVQELVDMVNTFLLIFEDRSDDLDDNSDYLTFSSLLTTLLNTQSSIDAARSELTRSAEELNRANLAAAGGVSSAADAQAKQALGTLRAAQANLAKTILRTPVSGTVNSLSVRTGDFIGTFSEVAVVANNGSLEIVTYVSDSEREHINVGDEVTIEGGYTGVISQIAPAVDSTTRKTEVRIATEDTDIVSGDTVRISKQYSSDTTLSTISVPLTAVKFEREDGYIFTVTDGRLSQLPVVLGSILGGSVEIIDGLSATDLFVVDARGLIDDEEVLVSE